VRLQTNDLQGATLDAADAVLQDPGDPEAKAILGTILIECGKPEDAAICLAEAVSAMPNHPSPWLALARAQDAMGQADHAIATLQHALHAGMRGPDVLNGLLLAYIRYRRFDDAITLGQKAQSDGALDATGFGLLGHALSSSGRHDQAFDAYREALKLAPEDPYVAHLAASSGAVAGKDRAPDDYLEVVFDGYAERFEWHLISLCYRVPGLMRQILTAHMPRTAGPALDLGCGTGLIGVAVGDLLAAPLTGIDLSRRMLELASRKAIYARLEQHEAIQFLTGDATIWSVILAADVLCYAGALEAFFTAISRRLAPDGLFLFNVEALDDDEPRGWRLGRQARFGHTEAYLRRTLADAGMHPVVFRQEALRQEGGAPVAGYLIAVARCESPSA
jgi:predicted TPR repeat methyltransferase